MRSLVFSDEWNATCILLTFFDPLYYKWQLDHLLAVSDAMFQMMKFEIVYNKTINEIVDFLFFRQDKVDVAVETKVVSNEKTPLQSDEIKYWKKLLKAFLQPAMLLLFVAAAIRHTGWFLYLFLHYNNNKID